MDALEAITVRTASATYPVEVASGAARYMAERMAAAGLTFPRC